MMAEIKKLLCGEHVNTGHLREEIVAILTEVERLRLENEALHRDRNDLALLTHRLIKRLRAVRAGKGASAGDAGLEDQVIKFLRRKGLTWLLPEDVDATLRGGGE